MSLDWIFPKAYVSFISNLFYESFENSYIDRIKHWIFWIKWTTGESTLPQFVIYTTKLRFVRRITKAVDEERYERIDNDIANLGSHMKPRCCGEKSDLLCFDVNKLKRYEANNKQCLNRKEC